MKTRLLIIIGISVSLFVGFSMSDVSAEEFYLEYFDGKKYKLNYEIINGTVNNLETFDGIGSFVFNVNGTEGKIIITIPKTIPFDYVEYQNELMIVLQNGEQIIPEELERSCDYKLSVKFEGKSDLEFITSLVIAGPRITYVELPELCLEDPKYNTEIQQKLKIKNCINNNFEKGFNIRNEVVCISPESYPWLNQRGYMKTFPIIS